MGQYLAISSISVLMLIKQIDSCPRGSGAAVYMLHLTVLEVLLFFCLSLQCHLWLQSHLWMTSMAAGLSVSQLWSNASSDSMHVCSSSNVAILIFSALIRSGISMHACIALMVSHVPGISSSLLYGCIWIASLGWIAVDQACTVFYGALACP